MAEVGQLVSVKSIARMYENAGFDRYHGSKEFLEPGVGVVLLENFVTTVEGPPYFLYNEHGVGHYDTSMITVMAHRILFKDRIMYIQNVDLVPYRERTVISTEITRGYQ